MRVFHLTRLALADAGEKASAGVDEARHEVSPRHRYELGVFQKPTCFRKTGGVKR